MDVDFDRGLTLPGFLGGLCNRQTLQSGVLNGFTLPHRQVGQHQRQVFVGVAGGFVTFDHQGVGPIVNVVVQAFASTVRAQMVDPFVPRNGVHPRREGLVGLIGVAFLVDRHQGFLHKVLDIAGVGLHSLLQKAPHIATHQGQCALIAACIALQGVHPQGVQRGFHGLQAFAQVNSS